jgi:hypothetical protein
MGLVASLRGVNGTRQSPDANRGTYTLFGRVVDSREKTGPRFICVDVHIICLGNEQSTGKREEKKRILDMKLERRRRETKKRKRRDVYDRNKKRTTEKKETNKCSLLT